MTLKHQYLLGILTILLFLRFVWQPVVEWQQDTSVQISLKQSQLDKIELLLGRSEQLLMQQEESQSRVQTLKEFIPGAKDLEAYRLKTQKEVETQASEKGLRIEQYRWLNSERLSTRIVKEVLEIRLAGSVNELASFQAYIEQKHQLITTDRITVNVSRTVEGKPSGFNGVLQLGFFVEHEQ